MVSGTCSKPAEERSRVASGAVVADRAPDAPSHPVPLDLLYVQFNSQPRLVRRAGLARRCRGFDMRLLAYDAVPDAAYAREYFRGVTVEGQLVWLFRDGRQDRWFLHGFWD